MSTQTKAPSSASGIGWTNAANIETSGSSFATDLISGGTSSQLLIGTNFGFSIPAGSTINGILVTFTAGASSAAVLTTQSVDLVLSGTNVGTGKGSATTYPTTPAGQSFGSSVDLWGWTPTVANINSSSFGFEIVVQNHTGAFAVTASVNSYKIEVFYTTPAGAVTKASCSSWF